MQLVLQGKILTPIISKRTKFYFNGCQAEIKNPRRRYFTKIVVNKPMFPYSFICYLGNIEIRFQCKTIIKTTRKLTELLKIESIGRFSNEGLGRIQWTSGYIDYTHDVSYSCVRKLRIRKGLPHNLPTEIQRLVKYALLHDFYHSTDHKSKIYVEPETNDPDFVKLLREHHDKTDNPLIKIFQKYDRLAAMITRKIRSPRTNRYNWYSSKNIDFEKLATEIMKVTQNIWKLYEYIYHSKDLDHLNESLQYGHTSLRTHLLIITNLIVQDFQHLRLKIDCTTKETDCRCQVDVSRRA